MTSKERSSVNDTISNNESASLYTYKFIIVGASGAGKTAILKRLVEDSFSSDSQSTIGVEFDSTNITIDNQRIKLQIWDTAGQERFHSIAKAYFRNAVGVFLVFDLSERKSFEAINMWLNDVHTLCDASAVCILIGNKSDLVESRAISTSEAETYAQRRNLTYLETSALNGDNVREAFVKVATAIYRKGLAKPSASETKVVNTQMPPQSNGGCKC